MSNYILETTVTKDYYHVLLQTDTFHKHSHTILKILSTGGLSATL